MGLPILLPLATCLLSQFCCGGTSVMRHNVHPNEWKLGHPPGLCGSGCSSVTWIAEEPRCYQRWFRLLEKTGLLIHSGVQGEYTRRAGDPIRHLSVSLCPIIKVNRKLWQHNQSRMTSVPDPSGVVTLASKTVGPAYVLSEQRRNTE